MCYTRTFTTSFCKIGFAPTDGLNECINNWSAYSFCTISFSPLRMVIIIIIYTSNQLPHNDVTTYCSVVYMSHVVRKQAVEHVWPVTVQINLHHNRGVWCVSLTDRQWATERIYFPTLSNDKSLAWCTGKYMSCIVTHRFNSVQTYRRILTNMQQIAFEKNVTKGELPIISNSLFIVAIFWKFKHSSIKEFSFKWSLHVFDYKLSAEDLVNIVKGWGWRPHKQN